jgi:hypothetical protein
MVVDAVKANGIAPPEIGGFSPVIPTETAENGQMI